MQPGILLVTVAAALLQGSHASEVSIKMPYLSPAGVTYIDTVGPQALTYAYPAQVEARHVGYAAAQVPAVAAVPYIKHIPTVSHVPVTKIEAQPALVEKQLDVVKPALSTRKFEVSLPFPLIVFQPPPLFVQYSRSSRIRNFHKILFSSKY